MEENIAILMADLSGYTALTETHGPEAAANLIDKYIKIAENCLVGDSKVHERTGDEIMIVSSSPDFLLATALMIGKQTSNEENFLRLHGGLHYGRVLKRANNYFGSAINLTSRLVSKAIAGSYLCSEEFVNVLSDKSLFTSTATGEHFFKNVSKQKQVFELRFEDADDLHIDPVCRMLIRDTKAAISHGNKSNRYFCSTACLEIYLANHQHFHRQHALLS